MATIDSEKWARVLVPRSTHDRIKKIAEAEGRKVWAVVDQCIPEPGK